MRHQLLAASEVVGRVCGGTANLQSSFCQASRQVPSGLKLQSVTSNVTVS